MKIKNVTPITGEYLDVIDDKGNYVFYMRHSKDNWLELMGNSWEEVYFDTDKLEKLYQEYMRDKNE